ncbi:MAG: hypothetical protein IJ104_00910 [Methanobrevibacter sp.]|nr:hypothetical protein [Methanobrevibacter sp.]MBQ9024930.1 hypothetical protein [Methanobrevibacter sp.]
MDKIDIFYISMIIFAVIFSTPVFAGALDGIMDIEEHTKTCIVLDNYEDEYTQLQPMPTGKTMILLPVTQHDYYFNTTKGVIPVTSKEYNHYNISDTLNISVNDKGRIREILN